MSNIFAIIEIGSNNTKTHIYNNEEIIYEKTTTIEFKKNYKNENKVNEEDLNTLIEAIELCNYVKVKGIMVIIPKGNDESNRFYFKKSKEIFEYLKNKKYKNIKMEILSMGMSNDYKVAIEEGSNMIRIGTGIFGSRKSLGGSNNV